MANALNVLNKILPKVLNKSLANSIQATGITLKSRVTQTGVLRVTTTGNQRITQ